MLNYKQRYKPRTEREYTKTDLTVYDSAGNTALNTLKVYGKSEVVDGVIKSAGDSGSIEVETCGKNLFNPSVYSEFLQQDDTYKATPGLLVAINTPLKAYIGKTLTFSAYLSRSGNYPTNMRVSAYINGELINGTFVNANTDTLSTLTITPETKDDYIYINYSSSGGAEYIYFKDVQLEYGSTATAYEPYNGTMATFTTGTPLYGINENTRDVMTWDGSAGTVTKNCYKIKLKDIITSYSSQYNFFYSFSITSLKTNSQLITPKYNYIGVKYDAEMNNAPNMSIAISGTQIKIKDTDYTTVSEFVASLGDTELVYELATPTTQNLTSTENASIAGLRTFTPQTHIQNNASTDMTVNYTIKVPTI